MSPADYSQEEIDGNQKDSMKAQSNRRNTMYYVKSWEKDEILSEHESLGQARRACKKAGHDGTTWGKWYGPIAWVSNDKGECVYNPRFVCED